VGQQTAIRMLQSWTQRGVIGSAQQAAARDAAKKLMSVMWLDGMLHMRMQMMQCILYLLHPLGLTSIVRITHQTTIQPDQKGQKHEAKEVMTRDMLCPALATAMMRAVTTLLGPDSPDLFKTAESEFDVCAIVHICN
jgi:hypothetical protein